MRSNKKPTCGSFYHKALNAHSHTPAQAAAFAAGFVAGQCEKVFLGACTAAMFRVDHGDVWEQCLCMVDDIAAGVYNLTVWPMPEIDEIWVTRIGQALPFRNVPMNSARWHELRGMVCGVPLAEIDTKFHERYK